MGLKKGKDVASGTVEILELCWQTLPKVHAKGGGGPKGGGSPHLHPAQQVSTGSMYNHT